MRNTLREKVYEALDGERAYQDNRPVAKGEQPTRSLGELILLQDIYVAKAKAAYAGKFPAAKIEALHAVRKVTALGVLIAELHGIEFRQ